jgi:ATP-dependent DNA helicase RecG
LERLHERGLIEGRGEKRGRVNILSGALYQRLKMQAEYVRAKGIEPEEMEIKVLDFVREHGKITRSDVADLCHISGPQASKLLQKISRQHFELQIVGERRWAHYIWNPLYSFL